MEHTKGPWKVLSERSHAQRYADVGYQGFGKNKIDVLMARVFDATINCNRNAQLIAAAPDLLEVCKNTLETIKMIVPKNPKWGRSEEHTSELQSHSFISYAVFCLKKKI